MTRVPLIISITGESDQNKVNRLNKSERHALIEFIVDFSIIRTDFHSDGSLQSLQSSLSERVRKVCKF